ncbi:hypothetical protein [Pseudoxanthomonas japonensis]|uniref:Transmembrane protein n=1 Tax=Pseudoxanthomonas japonensis TaxID=69284 RepID=A0ABQ6ZEK0_9GAMM|nr:hypothetical protein [Pseudoxanthomonas japonensis]KAF1723809.1 hypothetical protein CSC78_14545 [Pseudoxanthomonas japonensis]
MLNITPFGWFHTAISLVSLFGGLYALLRFHDIRYATALGKTYTWFTVATCLTSFFLMRTGKLSEAHGLTVLTLLVLAIAVLLGRNAVLGSWRHVAASLAFTLTVYFHFIPGFTETLTRVPIGAPLVSGPQDPLLQKLVGATFLVFLVGMVLQVRALRRGRVQLAHPAT